MADRPEDEPEDRTPPPTRPATSGPPYSEPKADENEPPPPGLEPEQRPAARWWTFGRGSGGPWDLVLLVAVLVVGVVLIGALVTGWWW